MSDTSPMTATDGDSRSADRSKLEQATPAPGHMHWTEGSSLAPKQLQFPGEDPKKAMERQMNEDQEKTAEWERKLVTVLEK